MTGNSPKKYFADFLQFTGIDEETFWQVIDSWRSPHIWERANGEWKLRHTVY